MSDILVSWCIFRPLQIDTDSFGKNWGSFKNEKRHKKITSHVKTPEMYTELVKTKLNFHPIQIIGNNSTQYLLIIVVLNKEALCI